MKNSKDNTETNRAKSLVIKEGTKVIKADEYKGREDLFSIILPKSLETIEKSAFEDCKNLETVIFNEGLKTVGRCAFYGCSKLRKVELPNSVESIKNQGFYNCSKLECVNLGNGLKEIGNWAFEECIRLKTIVFPKSLEDIGKKAFSGCKSLDNLTFGDEIQLVRDKAFSSCTSLKNVSFKLTWTPFGLDVFENTPFLETKREENPLVVICDHIVLDGKKCKGNVTVPEGITQIGNGAFYNSVYLSGIKLPDTLRHIGYCSFMGCSNLKEITLPDTIEEISEDAFKDCISLTSISYPEKDMEVYGNTFDNTPWLTEKTANTQIFCSCKRLVGGKTAKGSIKVADVRVIAPEAFEGNCDITDVDIAEGVEEIGIGAFRDCLRLKNINLPTSLKKIGYEAFKNCRALKTISIPEGIEIVKPKTFKDCVSLEHVRLPNSLKEVCWDSFAGCYNLNTPQFQPHTKVDDSALPCKEEKHEPELTVMTEPLIIKAYLPDNAYMKRNDLIDVVIEEGVNTIGSKAFYYCENLRSVHLPSTIIAIGDDAFAHCKNLQQINLPGNLKRIGNYAFIHTGLKEVRLPEGINSVGECAFYGSDVERVVLPDGIKHLKQEAFCNCQKLRSVQVSGPIKEIGLRIFGYCESLVEVTGTGIRFEADSFTECPIMDDSDPTVASPFKVIAGNLMKYDQKFNEEVVIPEEVTIIAKEVFKNHKEIKAVRLPNNLTTIREEAFAGCSNLIEINFPDSLTTIEDYAFSECGFKTIEWPATITEIERGVFKDCRHLTEIKLPDTLTHLKYKCLSGCNIHDVVLPKNIETFLSSGLCTLGNTKEKGKDETSRQQDTITLLNDNFNFEEYGCDTKEIILWNGDITKLGSNLLTYKLINDFCLGMERGYPYSEKTVKRNKRFIRELYCGKIRRLEMTLFSIPFLLLKIINKLCYIVFFPYYILQYLKHFSLKGETIVPDLFFEETIDRINDWYDLGEQFARHMGQATKRYLEKEGLMREDATKDTFQENTEEQDCYKTRL